MKKNLKNRVRKIYRTFTADTVSYVKAINGNADVLKDLIDEVEYLRKRVDELTRADFSFNRSAEIEQIVDAEMERRMME